MPLDLESLKNSVGGLLQSDAVQNAKSKLADLAGSDELKAVLPYLLSGGAGALAGGMVTGRQKEDENETRAGYLGRVLRNALLTGGLAAGGHYLLGKGLEATVGQTNDTPASGMPEKGPLENAVRNIAFSPLTAAGAGASALYATHDLKHVGAYRKGAPEAFLKRFQSHTTGAPSSNTLRHTATAKEIGDLERAMGALNDGRARRLAGLPSDIMEPRHRLLNRIPQSVLNRIPGVDGDVTKLKGALSTALRRGPLSTFGQSHPRRMMRGTLGLVAAGVPALLGAFLTNKD